MGNPARTPRQPNTPPHGRGTVKEKPPEGGKSWWLLDSDQRGIMHPVYSRAPSTTQANHQA